MLFDFVYELCNVLYSKTYYKLLYWILLQAIERYGNQTMNVHVCAVGDYLSLFWPDLTQAQDILESVKASLAAAEEEEEGEQVPLRQSL